ncbi:putative phage tail protein [Fusibacter sp. 3D3]|uniref:putative phage tail protein n=1 Tax=Fusibacter sp. 3D3 TaxID=1048380 RepID=UPI000852991E|nr:putative phage tail protein [Fusibacter sp. 3D3]GAU79502.1 phage-like element PBSX protein xkdT [Fusibacter sp. 3D3]
MSRYPEIRQYVPSFLEEAEPLKSIYRVTGEESGIYFDKIEDFLAQMYVETATWGLSLWEKMIDIKSFTSSSLETRREVIISKLRGIGTTSKEMIKTLAASFSGGEVEVIEIPEQSKFLIKFVGTLGTPQNILGLSQAIDEVKPAHLWYEYAFKYYLVSDVGAMPIETLEKQILDKFAF